MSGILIVIVKSTAKLCQKIVKSDFYHFSENDEIEASPEAVSEAVLEAEAVEPEESMDDLLENAFLRACKLSTKKAELPILSSNFYRLHIVASCPPGSLRGHSL